MNTSALRAAERIQDILDEAGRRGTDYEAFCALLDDAAQYAASKGWAFMEEASQSSMTCAFDLRKASAA